MAPNTIPPAPPPERALSGGISVMVVDDSAVIRGLITRTLESDPGIKVETSAGDGSAAVSFLKRYPVDVIVLDIEMPVMDGITAIPKLLEVKPDVKIIMASTLTLKNAEVSMKAMELGAVDYVPKPSTNKEIIGGVDFNRDLLEKVKAWGGKNKKPGAAPAPMASSAPGTAPRPAIRPLVKEHKPIVLRTGSVPRPDVIAIASSTGGPQALFKVMPHLKEVTQPIFITQHMPPSFTTILADHIKNMGMPCVEAKDAMPVQGGQAYLAPGNFHMTVVGATGAGKTIKLSQDPPENFCRPAADPMLRSLITAYGPRIFVIVLTGMGSDGFKGSQAVVQAGGYVISQDEATSVVWGMPAAVAEGGLCHAVMPIDQIGPAIVKVSKGGGL